MAAYPEYSAIHEAEKDIFDRLKTTDYVDEIDDQPVTIDKNLSSETDEDRKGFLESIKDNLFYDRIVKLYQEKPFTTRIEAWCGRKNIRQS